MFMSDLWGSEMRIDLLCSLLVAAATASTASAQAPSTPPITVTKSVTVVANTNSGDLNPVVCKKDFSTGSNIPTKICLHKREWDDIAKRDGAEVADFQHRALHGCMAATSGGCSQ
jgi:hypothetical protein